MLLSAALVLLSGLILGEIAGKLRLPKLTGMIAAGIIFRSFSKGILARSKIVLKDSIDGESTSLGDKDAQSLIGLEGECVTALRPVGAGDFGGRRLDIVSEGGFIQKGAKVRITAIDGVRIMVKEI